MVNPENNKSGAYVAMVWSLLVAVAPAVGSAQSAQDTPPLRPGQIRIKVINAQNNQPVTNERLNVALREDQVG